MNFPAPELDEVDRPRAATMKFTYPSGSRPLDGYTIKRGVGRGGFGEVYFATSDAGKEVALKLIRRNLEVELRGVTQCLNLKHPNLISLYDIRTDAMGDQWVVMEFVSGQSLEEVIDRHPDGMPVEQALWWMRGVSAGVAYLHDHGIVHRDLKPGNIFSDEGTVKIGDYGLAKFISCSRRSGQTESVGTVHYMAPEIANGRYGREIDTYALGIILFEMLTGKVPFEGESVGEVLMKHLTAEPDLSVLEAPYRDIVRRALAKDPEVRLKSVSELTALLPGGEGVAPQPTAKPLPHEEFASAPGASTAQKPKADDYWQQAHDKFRQRADGASRQPQVEEPIWKAIRETFSGEHLQKMHPLKKGVLIFALVALCIWNFDGLVGIAIPIFVCYLVYRAVWENFANARTPDGAPPKGRAKQQKAGPNHSTALYRAPDRADAEAARREKQLRGVSRRVRPSWRDRAQQQLAARPLREKWAELLTSMLLAAVFAALVACVAPLVLVDQPGSERMATYLWLATVGTIGSWAVLVPAKLSEGRLEDQVPMRMTMLLVGALIGVVAWMLGDALLLHTPGWGDPFQLNEGLLSHELLRWPVTGGNANPSLPYYVAYFAFLFLIPRWWRQSEYTRAARLSVWAILACTGWAWLVHVFWWFPQPSGMLAAAVIATATQLASPWMPPSRRRALAAEIEGGIV